MTIGLNENSPNLEQKQVRIAFIVSTFPAVSETFILNQITALIDRGHEVDIFALERGDTSKIHEDVRRHRLLERAFYAPSVPRSLFKRLIKGLWVFIANVWKHPVVVLDSLNIFKHGKRALSLRMLYGFIPFLKCGSYDIIHAHFGPNGLLAARLQQLGMIQGKLITTFHGCDMSIYIRNQGDAVYGPLFEKGDLFLPISERWKSRLLELGCDKNKTLVHHMGIDCRKLTFNARKPGRGQGVKFLTVARLVEKKGVEYGIHAIAKLSRKYENIEYNIVGEGYLRGRCDRLIRELQMKDSIHLLGWKNQKEVYDMIATSHILLCPSITTANGDQEGIPVVLMEAMAAGMPVISTIHSGIPELVQDGISGFLVPEGDVDALAVKLTYLIEHPETWSEMGRAGRAFVENHYDIDKLNDRLVEIYRELLSHS